MLATALVAFAIAAVAAALPEGAAGEQAGSVLHRVPSGYLDSGGQHTCALLTGEGKVRCWGDANGQLGYGNTEDIGDTRRRAPSGRWTWAPANGGRDCGRQQPHLRPAATGRCAAGDGHHGQLGYGNTEHIGDDEPPRSAGPVAWARRPAVQIAAGGDHTCALLESGAVRCWGLNASASSATATPNVGDNETPCTVARSTSVRARRRDQRWRMPHLRAAHHGTVRCWGRGNGQLGYGNAEPSGTTSPPVGGAGGLRRSPATGIAAGGQPHLRSAHKRSPPLLGPQRPDGQLGYGNTNTIGDDESPGLGRPGRPGAGPHRGRNHLGEVHTCAVLDNGTLSCWGRSTATASSATATPKTIGDDETPGSVGTVDLDPANRRLRLGPAATIPAP